MALNLNDNFPNSCNNIASDFRKEENYKTGLKNKKKRTKEKRKNRRRDEE